MFHSDDEELVEKEFKLFAALNAINNPSVLEFGILSLCYRGILFDKYHVLGFNYIGDSMKKTLDKGTTYSSLTILLTFQQAIRSLKYIHGKGVIHNDIKPENLLLSGMELFIKGKNCLSQLAFIKAVFI